MTMFKEILKASRNNQASIFAFTFKFKIVLFCLYKVNNKNKFIEFLNLFNANDYIKNELV